MDNIFKILIVIIVVNFSNIESLKDLEKDQYIDCNLKSDVISINRKVNPIYISESIVIDLKGKRCSTYAHTYILTVFKR